MGKKQPEESKYSIMLFVWDRRGNTHIYLFTSTKIKNNQKQWNWNLTRVERNAVEWKEWHKMPLNKKCFDIWKHINVLHIQKLNQQGWDRQTESKWTQLYFKWVKEQHWSNVEGKGTWESKKFIKTVFEHTPSSWMGYWELQNTLNYSYICFS